LRSLSAASFVARLSQSASKLYLPQHPVRSHTSNTLNDRSKTQLANSLLPVQGVHRSVTLIRQTLRVIVTLCFAEFLPKLSEASSARSCTLRNPLGRGLRAKMNVLVPLRIFKTTRREFGDSFMLYGDIVGVARTFFEMRTMDDRSRTLFGA
jgi:hypothetical protein